MRFQEAGTVRFRLQIGIDGKVIGTELLKSSGHNRLDDAAQKAYAYCQFTPGTVDGKPEPSWLTLEYVWKLEE